MAAALAVTLLAGACHGSTDQVSQDTAPTLPTTATAPITTNVHLTGLKGTAALTDVPATLRAELRQVDPTIGSSAADAVRPYDAVIVAALAAEEARTDAPARIAAEVIDVTSGGQRCDSFLECFELTNTQTDLHYVGASGALNLGTDGQTTETAYGEYEFNDHGDLTKLSNQSTELVAPTAPAWQVDPTVGPRGDGELRIGMVFPTLGTQALLGRAAGAGVRAAVRELNQNGGVVGRRVRLIVGDSQDGSEAPTVTATNAVLRAGADVVIGGVGQTDTAAMLDPVTSAGVVLIVPGTLSTLDVRAARSGYLFRLTPPDTTQGAVLANVVADDGITHVTVLDEGGNLDGGMASSFQSGFTARGGTITATVPFNAGDSAASVIDRATAQQTNGFVLLGDLPSDARLLGELYSRNLGPTNIATYAANVSPLLANLAS